MSYLQIYEFTTYENLMKIFFSVVLPRFARKFRPIIVLISGTLALLIIYLTYRVFLPCSTNNDNIGKLPI